MRPILLISIAFVSLVISKPSAAANEFCEKLQTYERTPLIKLPDGGLQRRWMEVTWVAPEPEPPTSDPTQGVVQIGATLRCESSDDVAKAFCKYAIHQTSHEFPEVLPVQILSCHGLASIAHPRRWLEDLDWSTPNDLIERLQIDQLYRSGAEPSMRLTITPYPESPAAKKPPPFFKALSVKLGFDDEE
jgi:hypothetical protein